MSREIVYLSLAVACAAGPLLNFAGIVTKLLVVANQNNEFSFRKHNLQPKESTFSGTGLNEMTNTLATIREVTTFTLSERRDSSFDWEAILEELKCCIGYLQLPEMRCTTKMNEGVADDMGIQPGNVVRVRDLDMHGA
jgi:hypothetical protein